MEGSSPSPSSAVDTPVMYLSQEHWSPRYDASFFTIKMDNVDLCTLQPDPPVDPTVKGKTNHPAYYYKIRVLSAHREITIYRRYSQFKWLCDQIRANPLKEDTTVDPVEMPPGTWFCSVGFCRPQSEAFAVKRMDQLRNFMRDLLQRPGCPKHPAVILFLDLDKL